MDLRVHDTIEFNFGEVEVNTLRKENINFQQYLYNTKETYVIYTIKRLSNLKPAYQVFHFERYQDTLKRGELIKNKLIYLPKIPNQEDTDKFLITINEKDSYYLVIRGKSIGPLVTSSVKFLNFLSLPTKKEVKKTFEIKNHCKISSIFQFNIDEDESAFLINPKEGTLHANKSTYITINFSSKEVGKYNKQLICYILNHEPIIVDLFGFVAKKDHQIEWNQFSLPIKETFGYQACFRETLDSFFNINCIDFGNLEIGCNRTEIIVCTNHLEHEIDVVWRTDENSSALISPNKIKAPPKAKVFFECQFNPTMPRKLIYESRKVDIIWKNELYTIDSTIPITSALTLIGNTYPKNESCGLTNIKVKPRILIIPVTLPGQKSYQTFLIKNRSHIPVLYKLIAPKNSNVKMVPMMGLIKTFQIVVVQLNTVKSLPNVYWEEWNIALNNSKNPQTPIYVKGEASYPVARISDNDVVDFGSVQIGCQKKKTVPLQNIGSIKFQFEMFSNDFVSIDPETGVIPPQESVNVTFTYTAEKEATETFQMNMNLQSILNMKEFVGEKIQHQYVVEVSGNYSQLCALPSSLFYGELSWGSKIEKEFYLFNYGPSEVSFRLNVQSEAETQDKFVLKPSKGAVLPGEKLKIHFSTYLRTTGSHKITIQYDTEMISEEKIEFVKLVEIEYTCQYPILQIEEIVEHNFNHLFTKSILWNLLQIQELNRMLSKIEHDETKSISLFLPEYVIGKDKFHIVLLLRNLSQFETEINLKREQLCDCSLADSKKHATLRKKSFECPHRDSLQLSVHDQQIYAGSTQLLTIEVKYLFENTTQMAYSLLLSNNRTIVLYFMIEGIPENTPKISKYAANFQIDLDSVYIGTREAPLQTFWLYNNTSQIATYKLSTRNIVQCCNENEFKVLECKNPLGHLQPKTAYPLLFRFLPIQEKEYQIKASLKLANELIEVRIRGEGSMEKSINCILNSDDMPESANTIYNFPVALSQDVIVMEPITIWSYTEKIFFIKNVTKNRVIEYSWGQVGISKVVMVNTELNNTGILKPNEFQAVKIKIKSFSNCCSTQLTLPCKLVDLTEQYLYKKSLKRFQKEQDKIENEFTITDKGMSKPKATLSVLPEPQDLYTTISLQITIVTFDQINKVDYFKQNPQKCLKIITDHLIESLIEKEKDLIHQVIDTRLSNLNASDEPFIKLVMECMIADAVFCDYFKSILEAANTVNPPYYNQFVLDDLDPNPESAKSQVNTITKIVNKPSSKESSNILKLLLDDTIVDTFKLGTVSTDHDEIKRYIIKMLNQNPIVDKCGCHF